jgi:ATP-dependent DNA helicase RecG
MRPDVLNPLFAEVEALKGVGPGIAKGLAKLGLTRAIDLAYHLPTGTIDRVRAPHASQALLGRIVVLDVVPSTFGPDRARRRCAFSPATRRQHATLTFFNNPAGRRSSCRSREAHRDRQARSMGAGVADRPSRGA